MSTTSSVRHRAIELLARYRAIFQAAWAARRKLAIVGQVDIVAVVRGRIVVSDATKTLQPLEASVVKRV